MALRLGVGRGMCFLWGHSGSFGLFLYGLCRGLSEPAQPSVAKNCAHVLFGLNKGERTPCDARLASTQMQYERRRSHAVRT
jgi:hypothetical protein